MRAGCYAHGFGLIMNYKESLRIGQSSEADWLGRLSPAAGLRNGVEAEGPASGLLAPSIRPFPA